MSGIHDNELQPLYVGYYMWRTANEISFPMYTIVQFSPNIAKHINNSTS